MKKICIAVLLLIAASGSGTNPKRKETPRDEVLINSVSELASAADRLNRSADSLGRAVNLKSR